MTAKGGGNLGSIDGDLHASVVADLHGDPTDTGTPVVATELGEPGATML